MLEANEMKLLKKNSWQNKNRQNKEAAHQRILEYPMSEYKGEEKNGTISLCIENGC